MPRLAALLVTVLAGAAAATAAERTPLAALEVDIVHRADGTDLLGLLEGTEADGSLRLRTERGAVVLVPPGTPVERRRTLAEAVARRGGEAIAAADWIDLQRVLRFAAERAAAAAPSPAQAALQDAALALAVRAQGLHPGRELLEPLLPMLWQRRDLAGLGAMLPAALAADPTWSEGWSALLRTQREAGDAAGAARTLAQWRERQPTALEVNRAAAAAAAAAGDWRTAYACWRKGFDLHRDEESAAGLALAALHRGEPAEAERACRALLAAGRRTAEANALLGAARLAQGDAAGAADPLASALAAGGLPAEVLDLAAYDLGLIRAEAGDPAAAAELWRRSAHPLAALALARQEGRPWSAPAGAGPLVEALAAEHNARMDLAAGRGDAAVGLDPLGGPRSQRLVQYAAVLAAGGAEAALRPLAAAEDPEALRWLVYGHLLADRLAAAESALGRLPADDAWGLAVRVVLAAARRDEAGARTWYQRLAAAPGAPAAYVARLAAEFASALDEELREGFDWPDAEVPAVGWQVAAPGTGIAVRTRQGRLALGGTQREAVATRAWRLVPAARLRAVQVDCAVADPLPEGLAVWLEVVDEDRREGWAIGPGPGAPRARQLRDGRWGPWLPLALPAGAGLRLEFDPGTCWAVDPADPAHRVRLGPASLRGPWAVGVAGEAPRGSTWTASFDDLVIGLRPGVQPP